MIMLIKTLGAVNIDNLLNISVPVVLYSIVKVR